MNLCLIRSSDTFRSRLLLTFCRFTQRHLAPLWNDFGGTIEQM